MQLGGGCMGHWRSQPSIRLHPCIPGRWKHTPKAQLHWWSCLISLTSQFQQLCMCGAWGRGTRKSLHQVHTLIHHLPKDTAHSYLRFPFLHLRLARTRCHIESRLVGSKACHTQAESYRAFLVCATLPPPPSPFWTCPKTGLIILARFKQKNAAYRLVAGSASGFFRCLLVRNQDPSASGFVLQSPLYFYLALLRYHFTDTKHAAVQLIRNCNGTHAYRHTQTRARTLEPWSVHTSRQPRRPLLSAECGAPQ